MKQNIKSSSEIARTLAEYLKETGQENLAAEVAGKIETESRAGRLPLKALVATAVSLNSGEKEYLLKELKLNKKSLPVDFSINPEIIGGLTIRVGDWFIDASLKNDLNCLKNTLLNP